MVNQKFYGKINPKIVKHSRNIDIKLKSNNSEEIDANLEIERVTFPIAKSGQSGKVKEAVNSQQLMNHLKRMVIIKPFEEDDFYSLIREKMYYKVSYFVKLLYNVHRDQITFDELRNMFYFDDFLRTSLNRLLPSIEQFVKSSLNSCLLDNFNNDSLVYLNTDIYKSTSDKDKDKLNNVLSVCASEISSVQDSNDAVRHHICKHGGNIPVWIVFDTITFGKFNMLVSCLERRVRQQWIDYMAKDCSYKDDFNMSAKTIPSHLQTIQILRNSASHLSRIYGRVFTYNPSIRPADKYWELIGINSSSRNGPEKQVHSLFTGLVSAKYFYKCMSKLEIKKWNKFVEKLDKKMSKVSHLSRRGYMGFPDNWKEILLIK